VGFFSRKQRSRATSIIPAELVAQLPEIGQAVFHEGRLGVDVSGFYLPSLISAGAPSPGSDAWDTFTDQFLTELLAAANSMGGWSIAGAFYVAKDFVTSEDQAKPRFVEIVDHALVFMAGAGVSSATIPMFALARWEAIQRSRP
jgi:hypothetical protein